jgi:serine/threonine protein kinase
LIRASVKGKLVELLINKDSSIKCFHLLQEHYIDAEVRVMKKLEHPYIIGLIADINSVDYMYLVMEIVNGGDLFDAITRVTRFSESQSRVMIKHLGLAMSYLHSKSIVHRDIKPENLLVSLTNFGKLFCIVILSFNIYPGSQFLSPSLLAFSEKINVCKFWGTSA